MATYYLQQWEKNGRLVIDSTFPHNAHSVKESREANCWIAAKKAFGFPLTNVHDALLYLFNNPPKR